MFITPIEEEFSQFLMEFKNFKIEYFNFMKENILSNKKRIKMCILSNLMEHIQKENSFALYDENIFEIYKIILENYKLFLDKCENIKIPLNDEMKKNLDGLISVLQSQVSFFEEKDNLGINPIIAEKKQIIAICLDSIYEDIEKLLEVSFEDLFKDFSDNDNNEIKESFIKYLKENIIKSYEKNMKKCFHNINDNENRQIISYYNDILEEEREILASIIKVQIKALEDLCQNEEENNTIEVLLNPIREIYQLSNKEFNEHIENIKTINPNMNIDISNDIENIFNTLNEILNNEDGTLENSEKSTYEKLKEFILKYLSFKYEEKKEKLSLLVKDTENAKKICEDIKNKFENMYKFIENNLALYDKTEFKDIINGIFESINIKVENLEENMQEFSIQCDNIEDEIEKAKNIDINLFEYDLNEVFLYVIKEEFEQITKYIDKNIFDKNFEKYTKLIEKTNKNIYNFKKDTILFEITTFEEIINYSVIRLRDNSQKEIKEFVLEIDRTTEDIQKILNDNNIFTIKPEPHAIFNAKEHEVLLAEKNEEFKKGEIIKVLNCGYKILDNVIIRANVIAAK